MGSNREKKQGTNYKTDTKDEAKGLIATTFVIAKLEELFLNGEQ